MSDLHSVHARLVAVRIFGQIVAGPPSVVGSIHDGSDEWNWVARFTFVWKTLESHGVALEVAGLEHLNDASIAAVDALEHDRLDRAGLEQLVMIHVVMHP